MTYITLTRTLHEPYIEVPCFGNCLKNSPSLAFLIGLSCFTITRTAPPIVRVLSGYAGGRPLKGPAIPGARPTSELVRGAIFNVLGPLDGRIAKVLDLFAGTGSLGIEALSRGVPEADFVESNRRQCMRIRENLQDLGLTQSATVHCREAAQAIRELEGSYQLVLMDPPYRMTDLTPVLAPLGNTSSDGSLLELGGTVVVGHSKRVRLADTYGALSHTGGRRYGDSMVDFFVKEG